MRRPPMKMTSAAAGGGLFDRRGEEAQEDEDEDADHQQAKGAPLVPVNVVEFLFVVGHIE
jgi:hypothetical protein